MPAASVTNSFQAFSATPVSSAPTASASNNDSSGTSFGQALANARQTGNSSTQTATSTPAQNGDAKTPAQNQALAQAKTTPNQAQTQSQAQANAQSQAVQDAGPEAPVLPDAASALLQDLGLADVLNPATTPTSDKTAIHTTTEKDKTMAPGDETSSWLAMLQAMQMVQVPVQPQTDTSPNPVVTEGSQSDGDASKAISPLGVWAAQQDNTADLAQLPAAGTGLLQQQGIQANSGKAADVAADVAAGDGNFLPQLQHAIADDAADKGADATTLNQLAAASQHRPVFLDQGATASSSAVAVHQIAEPVTDDKWGAAVAQRVSMMLGKQEQQLDMQLNPAHLGPMEVRLSMAQDQASVIFISQHAGVRDALAAATSQLSALLANQGITLTNVQVASDSLNQQTQQQSMERQFAGNNEQNQGRNQGNNTPWTGDADNGNQAALTSVSGTISVPVARSGLNLYI